MDNNQQINFFFEGVNKTLHPILVACGLETARREVPKSPRSLRPLRRTAAAPAGCRRGAWIVALNIQDRNQMPKHFVLVNIVAFRVQQQFPAIAEKHARGNALTLSNDTIFGSLFRSFPLQVNKGGIRETRQSDENDDR